MRFAPGYSLFHRLGQWNEVVWNCKFRVNGHRAVEDAKLQTGRFHWNAIDFGRLVRTVSGVIESWAVIKTVSPQSEGVINFLKGFEENSIHFHYLDVWAQI